MVVLLFQQPDSDIMAEGGSNPSVTGADNCDVKDSVVIGWNTGPINYNAG